MIHLYNIDSSEEEDAEKDDKEDYEDDDKEDDEEDGNEDADGVDIDEVKNLDKTKHVQPGKSENKQTTNIEQVDVDDDSDDDIEILHEKLVKSRAALGFSRVYIDHEGSVREVKVEMMETLSEDYKTDPDLLEDEESDVLGSPGSLPDRTPDSTPASSTQIEIFTEGLATKRNNRPNTLEEICGENKSKVCSETFDIVTYPEVLEMDTQSYHSPEIEDLETDESANVQDGVDNTQDTFDPVALLELAGLPRATLVRMIASKVWGLSSANPATGGRAWPATGPQLPQYEPMAPTAQLGAVPSMANTEFEKMFEQLKLSDRQAVDSEGAPDIDDVRTQNQFFGSKLLQLSGFSCSQRHPSALAIHCILGHIASTSWPRERLLAQRYITSFMATTYRAATRQHLLPILLSSMRRMREASLFSSCSPSSPQDLSLVSQYLGETLAAAASGRQQHLLHTLVTVLQRDLQVWWQVREEEETPGTSLPPLVFLAMGGARDFLNSSLEVVRGVYRASVEDRLADHQTVLTLVALVSLVTAWRDELDGHAALDQGNKQVLAACLAQQLGGLGEEQLVVELGLLQPAWLGLLVCLQLEGLPPGLCHSPSSLLSQLLARGQGAARELVLQRVVSLHSLHVISSLCQDPPHSLKETRFDWRRELEVVGEVTKLRKVVGVGLKTGEVLDNITDNTHLLNGTNSETKQQYNGPMSCLLF